MVALSWYPFSPSFELLWLDIAVFHILISAVGWGANKVLVPGTCEVGGYKLYSRVFVERNKATMKCAAHDGGAPDFIAYDVLIRPPRIFRRV